VEPPLLSNEAQTDEFEDRCASVPEDPRIAAPLPEGRLINARNNEITVIRADRAGLLAIRILNCAGLRS
jgi:hypothetical protein